jgi:hypothetical protein
VPHRDRTTDRVLAFLRTYESGFAPGTTASMQRDLAVGRVRAAADPAQRVR